MELLEKSEEALKEMKKECHLFPRLPPTFPNYPWHVGHRILDGALSQL